MLGLILLIGGNFHLAEAQLLSPGKLTKSHANLEGVTHCTNCHELGHKGIVNQKCLSCHTPLQKLIKKQKGYHATVIDQNCASCHKEHLGTDFDAIRFDTTTFDHSKTGFELIGKHTNVDVTCSSCHKRSLISDKDVIAFKGKHGALNHTFLGLSEDCASCHQEDNPHGKQFIGQDCSSCHTAKEWKDISPFDHSKTKFALLGKHQNVKCESCHSTHIVSGKEMSQFTGIAFENCIDCHKDVHDGAFGTTCKSCHTVEGWHKLASLNQQSFDHSQTGFDLVGAHATTECMSCHQPDDLPEGIAMKFDPTTLGNSYPKPEVDNCMSCHTDYHDGIFEDSPGGSNCESCHTQKQWQPSTYDIIRHNREAKFTLTGSHQAIPCFSCHRDPSLQPASYHFKFDDTKCQSCHEQDNVHGDEFADASGITGCSDCHNTKAWTTARDFDHNMTKFPLTGQHMNISCQSCHTGLKAEVHIKKLRFDDVQTDCKSCHSEDDPHHGQFNDSVIGSKCSDCHDTKSFKLASFDHSKTKFKLIGAHENVACASCHTLEKAPDGSTFRRYRPLSTKCESCHGQ